MSDFSEPVARLDRISDYGSIQVLFEGVFVNTIDIKQENEKIVSTKEMGVAIIEEMNIISGK